MPQDFVYFDLETQRSANDVGGWDHKDKMGMSVGVTYSTKLGEYRIYGEKQAEDLIQQIQNSDVCIGFNHISFDYAVLMAYTAWDLRSIVPSLDLMVELEKEIGHRPKLEAVASATLGVGKIADGIEAIKWWREGRIMDVARYCCFDVKVTKMVHEYGVEKGYVKYKDRLNRTQEVKVDWKAPRE